MVMESNSCDENQGAKLAGRSDKTFELTLENNQENSNNSVLLWLAASATLRKEFEKNKLANIHLRAVPVEK